MQHLRIEYGENILGGILWNYAKLIVSSENRWLMKRSKWISPIRLQLSGVTLSVLLQYQ